MVDVRYFKKLGFPQCAKEALPCAERLIHSAFVGRPNIARPLDVCSEIVSEFIFCERGSHPGDLKGPLNSIQELQLLEILCNYFKTDSDGRDFLRNALFLRLFPSGESSRGTLLVKLVSMAVATRTRPVLTVTGIWLQQSGVTAKCSLSLAQGLVDDYFVLVPEAVQRLEDLPSIAPQFTANFLAAVAELYGPSGGHEVVPPPALLAVITTWIRKVPGLCTASLLAPEPELGFSSNNKLPDTPYAGLFRWCILAPLQGVADEEVYSQLHLALMESAAECPPRQMVISAHQLALIVPALIGLAAQADTAAIQKALDRLGQAVLMFFHNQTIFGNIQELCKKLDLLPENRLLSIVKSHI